MGDWDIKYSPKGSKTNFIIRNKYFNQVKDIVEKVESKTDGDIRDVAEMYFTHKSKNWVIVFTGSNIHNFITIHVYGNEDNPTSFEVYDIDGEIINSEKM